MLAAAACGGDDDAGTQQAVESSAPAATSESEDNADGDGTDAGASFGQILEGTVELAGAVDETYTAGSNIELIAAGGCQGPQFLLQLQVNDTSIPQTIVQARGGLEEDLSGGATGTFTIDDLQVEVFEPGDLSQRRNFRGEATVEVTDHLAPDELNDRRMTLSVTADDLSATGDPALMFTADLVWVMGCP